MTTNDILELLKLNYDIKSEAIQHEMGDGYASLVPVSRPPSQNNPSLNAVVL